MSIIIPLFSLNLLNTTNAAHISVLSEEVSGFPITLFYTFGNMLMYRMILFFTCTLISIRMLKIL